jgi:uncharacterized protein (DUF58 family)
LPLADHLMERRRLSLTTRGAFALGVAPTSAVAGFLLGAEELVLLSLALVTLLLGGALQSARRSRQARGHWRLSVQLAGSDVEAGRPLVVSVTLVADGRGGSVPTWLEDPKPCWQRVNRSRSDGARRPLPNPSSALPVPRLAGDGSASFEFLAPTEYRGVYALTGLRLWCFDSVGLFAQMVGLGPSATITVHPVPTEVELTDELLRGREGPEENQPVVSNTPARRDNFGDFAGLRPYVPGDRLRLLYWPALARTGELMVRDFEDIAPRRVHVVVDVRPLVGYRGTEAVLAAAAGVGLQVLAHGATLELSTSSGEQIAIGPGRHGDTALMRAIAAIESTPPPATVGRRARRRTQAPPGPPIAHGFATYGGTPLVITTHGGANALPSSLGFSDLIIAA